MSRQPLSSMCHDVLPLGSESTDLKMVGWSPCNHEWKEIILEVYDRYFVGVTSTSVWGGVTDEHTPQCSHRRRLGSHSARVSLAGADSTWPIFCMTSQLTRPWFSLPGPHFLQLCSLQSWSFRDNKAQLPTPTSDLPGHLLTCQEVSV